MSNHRYFNYDDADAQQRRTEHVRQTNRYLSQVGKRQPPLTRLFRAVMALLRRTR